jgi:hypothetical protein
MWVGLVPLDHATWALERIDVQSGNVTLLVGANPALEAALANAVPADVRVFATQLGIDAYIATGPNDLVGLVQSLKALPDNLLVFCELVKMNLWLAEILWIELLNEIWGPAMWPGDLGAAGGGPGPGWWAPGANTVRVFAGTKGDATPPERDLAHTGADCAKQTDADDSIWFPYKTAVEAFSDRAVKFQLMMCSGFPVEPPVWENGGPRAADAAPQPDLIPFICTKQMAGTHSLRVVIKGGITQADIAAAPYGAGAIAAVPVMAGRHAGSAAGAGPLIAGWPPVNPQALLNRGDFIVEMMNYVALTTSNVAWYEAKHFTLQMNFGVPAPLFGVGGYIKGRLDTVDDALEAQLRAQEADVVDWVNQYNATLAGGSPVMVPKPGGVLAAAAPKVVAALPFAKIAVPKPAAARGVPVAGALPPAFAPLVKPPPPKAMAAPPVGAAPVPTVVVPAKMPPPPRAGVPKSPPKAAHPYRTAMDVFRRGKAIPIGSRRQAGLVAAVTGVLDDVVKESAAHLEADLASEMQDSIRDVIKARCACWEAYPMCVASAIHAIGQTDAFIHPADSEANAGAGGAAGVVARALIPDAWPGPGQLLTLKERTSRRKWWVDRTPLIKNLDVCPGAMEIYRQCYMRAGIELGGSALVTIRGRANGASGFVVDASPHQFILRDDTALCGYNDSSCVCFYPDPNLGTYGTKAYRVDREAELMYGKATPSLVIYSQWHRDHSELPLRHQPSLINQGLEPPSVGVASQAAILGSTMYGLPSEPGPLRLVIARGPEDIGVPDKFIDISALYANCLLSNRIVPLLFRKWDVTNERPCYPYLHGVGAATYTALNTSKICGAYVESVEEAQSARQRPEKAGAVTSVKVVKSDFRVTGKRKRFATADTTTGMDFDDMASVSSRSRISAQR